MSRHVSARSNSLVAARSMDDGERHARRTIPEPHRHLVDRPRPRKCLARRESIRIVVAVGAPVGFPRDPRRGLPPGSRRARGGPLVRRGPSGPRRRAWDLRDGSGSAGGSCDGPAQRARRDSLPDPRDGSRHGPVLPSLDDPGRLGPPRRPRPFPRRERRCVGGRTRPCLAWIEVRQVRRGLARPTVAGGLARTREGRGACIARGRPVDDPPHGP